MKFFSNETKENPDSPDNRSDVVTSDPVAVPQQRAGSPWNDTPSTPDDELAEQEKRDGTEEKWGYAQEATPTTTTYGPDGTVTEPDAESKDDAARDDGTFDAPEAVEPATGEPLDKTETSETSESSADEEARADAEEEEAAAAKTDAEPEAALDDDRAVDGPEAVDPTTGESLDKTEAEPVAVAATEDTAADHPAADEAAVVDSTDKDETHTEADAAPVAALAAVAATPGTVPAPNLDRIFPGGDTFAERFRDIQLVFVDSPKEATAQAAALVSEAVDAVTAALNEQKNALAADSDDTERLRVELRGYRDLLNRIVAL